MKRTCNNCVHSMALGFSLACSNSKRSKGVEKLGYVQDSRRKSVFVKLSLAEVDCKAWEGGVPSFNIVKSPF